RDALDSLRDYLPSAHSYAGRPNIIGTLQGKGGGRSLLLNGHCDVVPPEPLDAWTLDPWGASIREDRLYGRGAGDMKAGLIANFFALKAVLDAGIELNGAVMLQSVVDEEAGGGGGTLACLNAGFTADAMICTEPHALQISIAHVGVSFFRIRVVGRSSHIGQAHLAVNAIEKIYHVIQALKQLDEKRARTVHHALFERAMNRSCHLSVGTMRAGDWPTTVAGAAEIEGRISFIPGETMADVRYQVERAVRSAADKDPWLRDHPPGVEWFGVQTEPWYQDPAHQFVQTFRHAAQDTLKREVFLEGRKAACDARFSSAFGMAAACTGPIAGNVHGADEWVDIPSVIDATKVLACMLLRWCGYAE
ncbi:MAG TPA: ArgE/DapE family deacylase, partial [Dissulfurispiraceae bacterium]|nr:ArgE/DapE family deacylase [Dissulfurispiraceae bacterium]